MTIEQMREKVKEYDDTRAIYEGLVKLQHAMRGGIDGPMAELFCKALGLKEYQAMPLIVMSRAARAFWDLIGEMRNEYEERVRKLNREQHGEEAPHA